MAANVIVALGLGLVAAAMLSAARWWQHLSPWSLVLAASIASTVAFGIFELSVGSLEGSSAVVFVAAVCLGVALAAAGAVTAFFAARSAPLVVGLAVGFGTILLLIA